MENKYLTTVKKEKRYAVSMSFYVYANNEEKARESSEKIATDMRLQLDNNARITSFRQSYFGEIG